MKGVLIKVVWSKQNGEGNCTKPSRIASILLTSWSESGCVVSREEEWREVTAARNDESEWRGNNNKQMVESIKSGIGD